MILQLPLENYLENEARIVEIIIVCVVTGLNTIVLDNVQF